MKFKTKTDVLSIENTEFKITSVTNFDELYDSLIQKGQTHQDVVDEKIPYWAELWNSAIALAQYILTHSELVSGKSVLEIGAGLGLPSMAAAKMGGQVICTDYLADAVKFAENNALQNELKNMQHIEFDWRAESIFEPCDVLLASDVAYEKKHFDFLMSAFDKFVKPNGLILISEPSRYIAEPFIQQLQFKYSNFYCEKIAVKNQYIKLIKCQKELVETV